MLIRRLVVSLVVAAPLALAFGPASPAQAAAPNCGTPENPRPCTIEDQLPSIPGTPIVRNGPQPNQGPRRCIQVGGLEVRCNWEGFGSYNDGDGCYYRPASPQPAPPAGKEASAGGWYERTCGLNGGPQSYTFPAAWYDSPPQGVGMSPAQLARYILAQLVLKGADIQIRPKPGVDPETGKEYAGLIGTWVWMWTPGGDTRWGPVRDSETDFGMTVSLVATVDHITWNMGNGDTKTCNGPGNAYDPSMEWAEPSCGYQYKKASRDQSGGKYRVTATSTWYVDWQGGGEGDRIVVERYADNPVFIKIDEAQAVNK